MTKHNIQERIDALKQKPVMEDMEKHFGNSYDSAFQMDRVTMPHEKLNVARKRFLRENGTKKEFVKERMELWNKHHAK